MTETTSLLNFIAFIISNNESGILYLMKVKQSAIIVGLGLALGIGGVAIFLASKNARSNPTQAVTKASPTPTIQLATWKDQAGFTFTYPKELIVNKHDEDNQNYAHVELTSSGHPGSTIVWAKDSTWADVDAWVKGDKRFSTGIIAETTFGGQPGKKLLLSGPPQERVVGTISDDILFTVEGNLTDNEYWSGVYEGITNSFTFIVPNSTTDTISTDTTNSQQVDTDSGAADDQVDEEEVIE